MFDFDTIYRFSLILDSLYIVCGVLEISRLRSWYDMIEPTVVSFMDKN